MGKPVVAAEGSVKPVLSQTVSEDPVRVGLLVGQSIESKDIIALAVPTPSLKELGVTSDSGSKGNKVPDGDDLSEWLILDFSSQVQSFLPGGVEVLGVSVTCATPSFSSLMPRLAKLLRDLAAGSSTRSSSSNSNSSNSSSTAQQLLLLHYCTTTKKFKCLRLDTAEKQAGFKPAELKFKEELEPWVKVQAILSLDTHTYVPSVLCKPHPSHQKDQEPRLSQKEDEVSHPSYQKEKQGGSQSVAEIKLGMEPVLAQLQNAMVALRGHIVLNEADPLIKRGKRSQPPTSREVVRASLYLRHQGDIGPSPPSIVGGAKRVELKGNMVVIAYVHWKSSCGEAIKALKQDARRTISTRLQTMSEVVSQSQEGVVLEQLPVRASASVPKCRQFLLSEYLLPHEDTEECCARVGELLGVKEDLVEVKVLERQEPRGPEPGPLDNATTKATEDRSRQPSSSPDDFSKVWSAYTGIVGIIAAIGAVLLAIAFWIIMQPS